MTAATPMLERAPFEDTGALLTRRTGHEKRRMLVNRLMSVVATVAALGVATALGIIILFVVVNGLPYIDQQFLTLDTENYNQGGALAAILGSLQIVPLAALIAAPIAIMGGVYLAEARPGRMANAVRLSAETLAGLPSVVVGIFVFIVLVTPMGGYTALAGSIALAVIMIPILARSTEEIIRLVPASVREAALALGIPVWRTTTSVVLRTALAGILAALMLAVARAAGETAPLILTTTGNQQVNVGNLFGSMDSLPTFIWLASGQPDDLLNGQAWAASLVLMVFVLVTNILVRGRSAGRKRAR